MPRGLRSENPHFHNPALTETERHPDTFAMHFDLADLRLFVHIAESPSLTQGARRAHLSAAAASARIKALEGQLDSRLLYRDNRGVELTPSGQRLLQHARLILRQVERLKDDFGEQGGDQAGHIRIFANTTAVTEFLPEVLAGFLAERPAVTVDLQERLNRDIVRAILDGSADLGIVAGPVRAEGLEILHFSTDHLVLVVPPGHALERLGRPTLADTLGYFHVGLHEGSTLQSFLREQVERLGGTLNLRIQVASFEAACRMIEAGVGIGVLPETAARRHQRSMGLSILQLDEPWVVRERSVLMREREALPGCARTLVELLRRVGDGGSVGAVADGV